MAADTAREGAGLLTRARKEEESSSPSSLPVPRPPLCAERHMGHPGVRRIHEEESAVVCPVIDVIDWNTFEYLGNSGEPQIGGFDWRLVFTWHVVPERERMRMRSPIDVIR